MYKKLDTSKVEFSKRDKFFGIKIPRYLTPELAYETGVHIGDGHMGINIRPDGSHLFAIIFSGDWTEERLFHYEVIAPLIHRLYNKRCHITESTKNTVRLSYKSQAIATFKNRVLGLPAGNKKGRIRIPNVIMKSSLNVKIACLAGVVDTDFSLTFKRNGTYPRLSASFPIECKGFVDDIESILQEAGITVTICLSNRIEKRHAPPTYYKEYSININGIGNLIKWVNLAGFKNPKHYSKLLVWRKFGKCLGHTTTEERLECLSSSMAERYTVPVKIRAGRTW
ncbi:MAG: hypothetical protein HY516_02680 [Candidatus Aenigmarchaeota archaeon]|nr:hypothetical protein [Candidatus Aenigmarchaeota archaeon]